MKIKHKLFCLTSLSVFALASIVAITELSNLKLFSLEKTFIKVKALEISLLELNRIKLEFLDEKTSSKQTEFDNEFNHFQELSKNVTTKLAELELGVPELANLDKEMSLYNKDFNQLVRNFGKDSDYDQKMKHEMKVLFDDIFSAFRIAEKKLDGEIKSVQNYINIFVLLSVTVVAVVLITLSYFIIKSIQKNISRLNQVMETAANSHDLTVKANIDSNDEIADISKQLNRLLSSIEQLVHNVQSSAQELATASNHLQKSSDDTEKALNQQQLETDSVATAVTEMGETIKEVASTTERAAVNTRNSYDLAHQGLDDIGKTRYIISELSSELGGASTEVTHLSELSEQISSVLDVIKGIAEQTNLLALNAAIEAARAGEQGRGFAVVADEVRTLAGRTQNSTEEISNIILAVQEQTQTVVEVIKHCSTKGQDSSEIANQAHTRLASIMDEMQSVLDNSTQIAAAVEEQSTVSAEIARNVNVIRDLSALNIQAVAENTQSAAVVASHANGLTSAIKQFKT